jgi:hypothetical protein
MVLIQQATDQFDNLDVANESIESFCLLEILLQSPFRPARMLLAHSSDLNKSVRGIWRQIAEREESVDFRFGSS